MITRKDLFIAASLCHLTIIAICIHQIISVSMLISVKESYMKMTVHLRPVISVKERIFMSLQSTALFVMCLSVARYCGIKLRVISAISIEAARLTICKHDIKQWHAFKCHTHSPKL